MFLSGRIIVGTNLEPEVRVIKEQSFASTIINYGGACGKTVLEKAS